ncbi:hypothetical protein GCM10020258_21090 [Sphingomonas yabuuchiae]
MARNLDLMVADLAFLHDHLHVQPRRLVQCAEQEFAEEPLAGIAVEHADADLRRPARLRAAGLGA